jgi:hypothetical protein
LFGVDADARVVLLLFRVDVVVLVTIFLLPWVVVGDSVDPRHSLA